MDKEAISLLAVAVWILLNRWLNFLRSGERCRSTVGVRSLLDPGGFCGQALAVNVSNCLNIVIFVRISIDLDWGNIIAILRLLL